MLKPTGRGGDPCGTPAWRWAFYWGVLVIVVSAGCRLPPAGCPSPRVGTEISHRTGHAIIPSCPGGFVLPPHADLSDGVSEDEAIATALSNNAAFQATLTQLTAASGDRVQAGLLTNPSMSTFIPAGVKQWEWTLYVPLEAFVLRPHRVAVAESDYQRVANQLVQNGLALVRDVRVAHINLGLAVEQWQLAQEAVSIRDGIADLTRKQLQRGDISELEAMTARIDALNARANAAYLEQNIVIARARLAQLMGLTPSEKLIQATLAELPPPLSPDVPFLVSQSLAMRPDARAAEWAVEAAAERTTVARWLFLRFDVAADANSRGLKGFEIGPGLRFDIPIFNRNQGGVTRACAELEQAEYSRDAVHDQIVQEVRSAAAQYLQAQHNYEILRQQVVPALEEALHIAEKGFADGGASYLLVLQTASQYLDSKSRMLDQLAALQRARAELERSVGCRLRDELEPLPLPQSIRTQEGQ